MKYNMEDLNAVPEIIDSVLIATSRGTHVFNIELYMAFRWAMTPEGTNYWKPLADSFDLLPKEAVDKLKEIRKQYYEYAAIL